MTTENILTQLRAQRETLTTAITALERLAGGNHVGRGGVHRRRRMSPEAKKRISEAMKKRWAERGRKAKTG